MAGPLGCGLLAQLYGWHAGFGLAGVLMLIGLATYIAGFRALREEIPQSRRAQPSAPVEASQWRIVAGLIAAISLTIFQSIAYNQNTNMGLIWIDRNVDLGILGFHIPVAWFNSIDSFVSIVVVAPLFALWRWQDRHGGEPGEIAKIGTGAFIAAAANVLLVIGCIIYGNARVPVLFPVTYDILLGIAFMYYWPTILGLVSRAAPAALKATMMGFVFMSSFVADVTLGWIGAFYEHMSATNFWALHAGIAAVGGVLCFIVKHPLQRLLLHENTA